MTQNISSRNRRLRRSRLLGTEFLENRLMLDGSGGQVEQLPPAHFDPLLLHQQPEPCLLAAPHEVPELCGSVDSSPGRDVHSDRADDTATPLPTADDRFERVHSYLDSVRDIDALSVIATGNELHVSALLFYVPVTTVLRVIDEATHEVIAEFTATDANSATDGFVDCECGDYGFIDLFPGLEVPVDSGSTYFVTLDAGGEDRGRYLLDVFDVDAPETPIQGNPDSAPGEDPHGDRLDDTATLLPQEHRARVDTFIDDATDVDVFSITPYATPVQVSAFAYDDDLHLSLEVWDNQQRLLATSHFADSDRGVFDQLLNMSLDLRAGESYYLRIRSLGGTDGEYVLLTRQGTPESSDSRRRTADSRLGEDPHPGTLSNTATTLSFDESTSNVVHSHIDAPGDRDVFRWVATGPQVQMIAANLRGIPGLQIQLYTPSGTVLSPQHEQATAARRNLLLQQYQTQVGQTYFVVVSGGTADRGTYYLDLQQTVSGVTSLPASLDAAIVSLPGDLDRNDAIGLRGDANLDTFVDATDYNVWRQFAFEHRGGPEFGDFNVDGIVDGLDFHVWFQNRFSETPAQALAQPARRTPRAANASEAEDRTGDSASTVEAARLNVLPTANLVANMARRDRPANNKHLSLVDTRLEPCDVTDVQNSVQQRFIPATIVRESGLARRAPASRPLTRGGPVAQHATDALFPDIAPQQRLDAAFAAWER